MPPYDDWNKIDDEEEEELLDDSVRLHVLYCYSFPHRSSSLKEREM